MFSEEEAKKIGFSIADYWIDQARLGGQAEFWKRYIKLNSAEIAKIRHNTKNMENAFQHAYTAAYITMLSNEEIAKQAGYFKETNSELIEKLQGKTTAFLDTNRDLWNNEAGISYALRGKKDGKELDEIADNIFKNIISDNSDFIIDYKNDKRRWDKNATEENLWKKIKERGNSELFDMAKKSIKNILPKNSTTTDKKEKTNSSNWSIENHKAFLEGFDSGILGSGEKQKNNNKKDDSSNNSKKAHWTDKFNIGNPETDKGHWVTLDNGKHIFIKDT